MVHLHREDDLEIRDDIVGQSINHPIGHAVQALFSWWYRQNLRDGQGLSGDISRVLSEVSNTASSSYRLGRVLFGPNLIALFRVDQAWTQRHVLPLLDWARSAEEASALWKGFLWTPRTRTRRTMVDRAAGVRGRARAPDSKIRVHTIQIFLRNLSIGGEFCGLAVDPVWDFGGISNTAEEGGGDVAIGTAGGRLPRATTAF